MAFPYVIQAKLTTELDEIIAFGENFQLANLITSIFSCDRTGEKRVVVNDFTFIETIESEEQDFIALLLDKVSKLPQGIEFLDRVNGVSKIGMSLNPEAGTTTHFFIGKSNITQGIVVLEIVDASVSNLYEFEDISKYPPLSNSEVSLAL